MGGGTYQAYETARRFGSLTLAQRVSSRCARSTTGGVIGSHITAFADAA
ncbi:hypothetical protein SRABI121_00154 [Microbacterium sp. Bi121]|nr:hypothetical protein SRABI121_00154 [Microbacterium sp. Bi121]